MILAHAAAAKNIKNAADRINKQDLKGCGQMLIEDLVKSFDELKGTYAELGDSL